MAYVQTPGMTGNISAGGEYDNLDTTNSLLYPNMAADDASAAALSAAAAAASALAAAASATEAEDAVGTIGTAVADAEAAALAAQTAQGLAEDARDDAQTYAGTATTQAGNAATSASTATTQAGIATTQAGNAATSAGTATTQAGIATTAAGTATTQAGIATTQAGLASGYATDASGFADDASGFADAASSSAGTATTQAGIATTQAGIATTQAGNAATSAGTATTQAGIATTAAGTATTQAGLASGSADDAIAAQAAAEAARDQALAAFDNFDDKYLGEKASDPTVDNDGNPLQVGALYFNTVSNAMKVYTGSAWVAAYVSGAGYLLATNNLSELTSASTARTNLGLGTAATTNSTAYATAAQGTLADSAVQPGDLATVATTGAYSDLSGKPTLGTAAAEDTTYFATAAQGVKADTALQSSDIGTSVQGYNANTVVDSAYVHTDNNYTTTEKTKLSNLNTSAQLPSGGSTGQILTKVDGTNYNTTWATIDALPSQAGNSGKYLTTDGTSASWGTLSLDLASPPAIGDVTPNAVDGTVIRATNGILVNSKTVSSSYTISSTDNAISAGPVSIASGQTVTISSGSRWVIV